MFGFLFHKIKLIFLRLYHVVIWLPKRVKRLFIHLWNGIIPGKYNWWPKNEKPNLLIRVLFWWWELILYFGDMIGFAEFYEILLAILKINTRSLNEGEVLWAKQIFGNSIPLERVTIDQKAILGPPWARIAYVSGFTINSWGQMRPPIFIHELTHVWQYHQVGLVYISRALWAQYSRHGYDYGGPAQIWERIQNGELLESFNFEQQAEVVADYFRILHQHRPEYHYGITAQPAMYASILSSIDRAEV